MNAALLAKLGWSVATKEDKLWVKYVYAKYLKGKSFLDVKKCSGSSWIWQSILNSRSTLAKGFCWRISKGTGIDVWNAPWISSLNGFKPHSRLNSSTSTSINWVSDLIQDNPRRWNDELLKECFDDESIAHINKIHLGQFPQADKVIWSPSNNGAFSTKSAFWTDQVSRFNSIGPLTRQEWNMLWKLKIHDRLKLLLWKIIWNSLPTREVIGLRFELDSLQCPLCGSSTESFKHLFLECPIS